MPKFEEKYIHCVWDDGLKGKKVFYSDSISELRKIVEENDQNHTDVIVDYYAEDYPFSFGSKSYFAFCYLDPNYELKVALEQGKTIQRFFRAMGEWCDLSDPSWVDTEMYRIKPEPELEPEKEEELNYEKPVTNRELAEWLARGNGEICMSGIRLSYHNYEEDDKPVTDMFVRKWDDVWHRPTREYLGLH